MKNKFWAHFRGLYIKCISTSSFPIWYFVLIGGCHIIRNWLVSSHYVADWQNFVSLTYSIGICIQIQYAEYPINFLGVRGKVIKIYLKVDNLKSFPLSGIGIFWDLCRTKWNDGIIISRFFYVFWTSNQYRVYRRLWSSRKGVGCWECKIKSIKYFVYV